jgi:hypothetical protein
MGLPKPLALNPAFLSKVDQAEAEGVEVAGHVSGFYRRLLEDQIPTRLCEAWASDYLDGLMGRPVVMADDDEEGEENDDDNSHA